MWSMKSTTTFVVVVQALILGWTCAASQKSTLERIPQDNNLLLSGSKIWVDQRDVQPRPAAMDTERSRAIQTYLLKAILKEEIEQKLRKVMVKKELQSRGKDHVFYSENDGATPSKDAKRRLFNSEATYYLRPS